MFAESAEYSARFTVTGAMGSNGDVYRRTFNGSCTVGLKKGKSSIAQRAEAYLQAVSKSQGPPPKVTASSKPQLPRLEVVSRVAAIPIVESGIGVTEKIYFRIKESNALVRWYLSLYERSLATGVQLARPAVQLLEAPLHQLDRFLCASLDVVERRVPSIHLPPQTMYSETRQYVLRRADSVKQLGTAVLDSRVTCATASALDRALATADKYVDKYLPPDTKDPVDGGDGPRAGVAEGQGAVREPLAAGAREPGAARDAGAAGGAAGARDGAQDGAPRQLHAHRPSQKREHRPGVGDEAPLRGRRRAAQDAAGGLRAGRGPRLAQQARAAAAPAAGQLQGLFGAPGHLPGRQRGAGEDRAALLVRAARGPRRHQRRQLVRARSNLLYHYNIILV